MGVRSALARRPTKSGLTPQQERIFHWIAAVVIILLVGAWAYGIRNLYRDPEAVAAADTLPSVVGSITSKLGEPAASAAFLNEAALALEAPLRGRSGKLRAVFREPGEQVTDEPREGQLAAEFVAESGQVYVSPEFKAPANTGIYRLAVGLDRMRQPLKDLNVITIVPFGRKQKGRIGTYMVGSWPYESGGTPQSKRYANPDGFVEVTLQNRDTYVSEHFRLRDFLTKDQPNVWPKYVLLDSELLDKLELVIAELQSEGIKVEHMAVMSGFRTPRYNESGGNTAGRANLSRHMYGDAADVFVDNDRNGMMDDINGDGRVDVRDAETIAAAAERVERKYPDLVGGIGIYVACCGHGPYTHIDVRGYRARWRGTGNG